MLTEVPPDVREPLRPLFDGFPGLHGWADAILEGAAGVAFADDPSRPNVALLELDFDFLAGDAGHPAAAELARKLEPPASLAASSGDWESLLRRVWGDRVSTYTRVAFQAGDWDRARLDAFIVALPDGYVLKRIDGESVRRFRSLEDSLVYNFDTLDDFLARGVGFGVEHEGKFVSGCSSFTISSRSLEFEIQTHPDFRRRGLATAAAAAMIEHCIDSGLEPCWDAHNPMSAALATKLGFAEPAPYTAYEIR